MACFLKQSTAVDIAMGPFVDSTDGFTPETGLTITQPDIRLKKNAGNWAQKNASQTLSHEENGWYEVALDATDTNTLGILMVAIYESGALPVWREFMVVPANVYDSLVGGADTLQVDVAQFGNSNGTFASGRPEVNATHIAGSAVNTSSAQLGVNVVNAAGTAWGSGAITAAAIASNALTDAKFATDAFAKVFSTVVEGSYTLTELIRGFAAALFGKASGLGTTTAIYRNTDDDVDVITATVDADGNRTAVTLDLTDTP